MFNYQADGVLMTYDVTKQASLLNIRNWLSDLDEMTQVVVVGNKCDLVKGLIKSLLQVKLVQR